LTHRDCARAVTFVTGHRRDGGVDVAGLVADGLDPANPAAVVERGGTARQRVLRGTLDSITAEAPGWVSGGPALLLVGDVVGRGAVAWRAAA
jgi:uroporphyrin-III C-methyltransferase/precorrin-2 dehydrogenase/sirohydrochlorin ferrochelatase